jgi:hypothetical protein
VGEAGGERTGGGQALGAAPLLLQLGQPALASPNAASTAPTSVVRRIAEPAAAASGRPSRPTRSDASVPAGDATGTVTSNTGRPRTRSAPGGGAGPPSHDAARRKPSSR